MTKNEKLKVSLFRAFLGFFGVDAFIMKKLPQAITRLVWGVALITVVAVLAVLSILQGGTGLILTTVAIGILVLVRVFLYFLGGLLMLNKPEEEIEEMYK